MEKGIIILRGKINKLNKNLDNIGKEHDFNPEINTNYEIAEKRKALNF